MARNPWQQTWGPLLTDLEPLTNAADGSLPDEWALDAITPADAVDDMVWLYNAHRLKGGRILWTGVFGKQFPVARSGLLSRFGMARHLRRWGKCGLWLKSLAKGGS